MTDADVARALGDGLNAVADHLLMHNTNPWELDAAMIAHGFRTGVCEMQDSAGLDLTLTHLQKAHVRPITPILPRMVGEGRLGRKLSVGWYRYPGGGGLVIDPLVEDLLREEAWFLGVARFEVSEEVLADKLVLGLIDSALRLLGTSALQDIARIDRVSIDALGFPAEKGGILSYARDRGQRARSELLSGCHATDRTLQSGLDRLFSTA